MPWPYVVLHLMLIGLCLCAALRAPLRSVWTRVSAVAVLGIVGVGLGIERRQEWAWTAMRLGMPDLVFLTNLSLEGAVVLLAILWRTAEGTAARRRALILSLDFVGIACASWAWLFQPLPERLTGTADATGFCPQTSPESCSAAAAVILLGHYGIRSTEAEMAELCLTRRGEGTMPLGLYRGLASKSASAHLRPELIRVARLTDFHSSARPAIISVGLKSGCSSVVRERMESYGWEVGKYHSVVVLGADPAGNWLDVADPSFGREHWPADDLHYIWNGYALRLTRR